jgi:hypothetical protein
MSGSPPSTPQAAHEALAALERYQSHLRQLAVAGVEPELYHQVSLDIHEVRRCCHELPPLSAGWVALLISHAEHSQALWRAGQPQGAPGAEERQQLLGHVMNCVRALQAQCMDLAAPHRQ